MSGYVVGFIGAGNMGGVIAKNVCGKIGSGSVIIACSSTESSAKKAEKLGCAYGSVREAADGVKYLFLGVKPQNARDAVSEIKDLLASQDTIVVSMLAGVSLESLAEMCGTERIIRIMPNTPAAVGEGMTLVTAAEAVGKDELEEFCRLLSLSGRLDIIPEKLMDAASALSGCGPAFVYMFIEALADGAVRCGLPRASAVEYASQTLIGAATLVLESGKHTGELKDAVCSPDGSTIAGVAALENGAFRSCAMNAVYSSFERTKELGKK